MKVVEKLTLLRHWKLKVLYCTFRFQCHVVSRAASIIFSYTLWLYQKLDTLAPDVAWSNFFRPFSTYNNETNGSLVRYNFLGHNPMMTWDMTVLCFKSTALWWHFGGLNFEKTVITLAQTHLTLNKLLRKPKIFRLV